MRNRHGGVFMEQQLHQGPPDQIGAPDHDRVHAFKRSMHALRKDDAAEWRAGRERDKAAGEPPGIVRMQPIDVLGGIDGVDDGFRVQRFRQRQLHQDAMHACIAIEPCDQCQQFGSGGIGRQSVLERRHAGPLRLGVLAADIDFAGRIVADQYHCEPGRQAGLALDAGDLAGDADAKLRGNGFSIDDAGRHL